MSSSIATKLKHLLKGKKTDNKFIGTFVNEMYAILLGIGIGNVLFVQQIDLSNLFEVLMGLFITAVILIYWWDWTEFINDNVVTSKREFIIDFGILICLEVLYLYYNDPHNLIIIFFILSLLDFFWVFNYIIYKSDNFIANSKKWILEKIVAIIIIGAAWILLTTLREIHILMQGLIVIASFIAIRLTSFRQLTQISDYELIEAKEKDLQALCNINNSHLNPDGKKSFIISKITPQLVSDKIAQEHQYYILNIKNEDKIIGFIELSNGVEKGILDQVTWINEDNKVRIINSDKDIKYIEKIAIHPDYAGKGIGTAIYRNLFDLLPSYSFYSFVMVAPFHNEGSVKFHEKMNFKATGTFSAPHFAGFENYQSILYSLLKE